MQPLIVMGMGRSGTRYFADILNSHKSVLRHGEIRHTAMAKFFALLDELDKINQSDSARLRAWRQRKGGFILDAFSGMAMGGGEEKNGYVYVGHKTPRSEKFFNQYEKHFSNAGMVPRYFYCIRNPFDVWASFKNMPWNTLKDVEHFIEIYLTSYNLYEKSLTKAKERIQLLNLDEFKLAQSPGDFLKSKLFDHVELETSPEFIETLYEKENRNSSQSVVGKNVSQNTQAEQDAMYNNAAMRNILDTHFPWLV